jgi:sortase A
MNRSPWYWIQGALLVAAAFALGQWAETELTARRYQHAAARILEEWRIANRSAWSAPASVRSVRTRAQARETGVVGRLRIQRLGLSAMVGEGIDDRTLDRAVGHIPGSAFPGEEGNVALAGHRDTFLRRLSRVRRGDRIQIVTPDGSFEYRVERTRVVSPRAVHVLRNTGEPLLTIVTCYPFRAIGPAPDRFVVHARRTAPASDRSKTSRS